MKELWIECIRFNDNVQSCRDLKTLFIFIVQRRWRLTQGLHLRDSWGVRQHSLPAALVTEAQAVISGINSALTFFHRLVSSGPVWPLTSGSWAFDTGCHQSPSISLLATPHQIFKGTRLDFRNSSICISRCPLSSIRKSQFLRTVLWFIWQLSRLKLLRNLGYQWQWQSQQSALKL